MAPPSGNSAGTRLLSSQAVSWIALPRRTHLRVLHARCRLIDCDHDPDVGPNWKQHPGQQDSGRVSHAAARSQTRTPADATVRVCGVHRAPLEGAHVAPRVSHGDRGPHCREAV